MVARKALMQWFRTIPRFVRALVALFVLAQFAGVVSSPLTQARTASGAAIWISVTTTPMATKLLLIALMAIAS